MAKTVVLLVYGDGDYGAMTFNEHFNEQKVYEAMVAEGVTKKTIIHSHPRYGDEEIYAEIHEFGDVDPEFFQFLLNEYIIDEDNLKARDIHFVEAK